ncbi:MAG: (d)CMP kinase [Myxococcaceae bacterium]|nr:(d)CMP kinase [Myxococcaceae bacterium]
MTTAPFIVAIDGPAGAGKSSVSKAIAERLSFSLVDTGAIYRCAALAARRAGIAADDDTALGTLTGTLAISFKMASGENRVFLGGEDVSEAIRTPENSSFTSQVSARPVVRQALLDLQRQLARTSPRGAILEGRDIGTVVFPDADVKLFITASDEARANRRFAELTAKGIETTFDKVLADQRARDLADETREVAPLRAAEDALIIDTTALSLQGVIDRVIETIEAVRLVSAAGRA